MGSHRRRAQRMLPYLGAYGAPQPQGYPQQPQYYPQQAPGGYPMQPMQASRTDARVITRPLRSTDLCMYRIGQAYPGYGAPMQPQYYPPPYQPQQQMYGQPMQQQPYGYPPQQAAGAPGPQMQAAMQTPGAPTPSAGLPSSTPAPAAFPAPVPTATVPPPAFPLSDGPERAPIAAVPNGLQHHAPAQVAGPSAAPPQPAPLPETGMPEAGALPFEAMMQVLFGYFDKNKTGFLLLDEFNALQVCVNSLTASLSPLCWHCLPCLWHPYARETTLPRL
jgi:hypothetical protein